jgi:hypothetical protein
MKLVHCDLTRPYRYLDKSNFTISQLQNVATIFQFYNTSIFREMNMTLDKKIL